MLYQERKQKLTIPNQLRLFGGEEQKNDFREIIYILDTTAALAEGRFSLICILMHHAQIWEQCHIQYISI